MGAILTQIAKNGKFHSISYASKQLINCKKKSLFLLEIDAVVWEMKCYQEHLRGRRFFLYTDHKPLECLSTLQTKTMNRLQLAMMDIDFEIRNKKGSKMPAHFLSRSFIIRTRHELGTQIRKEQFVKLDQGEWRQAMDLQIPHALLVQES
jgi:hypothetical protein